MASKITLSISIDLLGGTGADDGSSIFTPTGDFLVACGKGALRLEALVDGRWFGVMSSMVGDFGKPVYIKQGCVAKFSRLEPNQQYRLVGCPSMLSSGEAYNVALI